VFSDTLLKLAAQDDKILAITAAMTGGTGLTPFAAKYPDRFFDVGIAEQHAVTMSAALAASGYKPVVAIYSTFLQRAFDQVLHDTCIQNLPIVLAIDRAGIVGDDGSTHQGVFDITFLRSIPNITIMAPKDENELQHMLKTAVDHTGPCAVRYPRGSGVGCEMDTTPMALPIGQAEVLRRGSDITIVAIGNMVSVAEEAAGALGKLGVQATLINARFIKPLDVECLTHYAAKTKYILTIEEHILAGGFGSAVMELLETQGLRDVQVVRLGIPDEFVEHGHPSIMRKQYGLTPENIVKQALTLLGKRPRLVTK
jgi:1-deoxy-D-xylulose-5-phosphate synthase